MKEKGRNRQKSIFHITFFICHFSLALCIRHSAFARIALFEMANEI
jgi:hypothetical protein